jgi:protease I
MTAQLVKGRTLTAWQTVQDDLELAGANVGDEPVVIDRNWITSRKPDDLPRFSEGRSNTCTEAAEQRRERRRNA